MFFEVSAQLRGTLKKAEEFADSYKILQDHISLHQKEAAKVAQRRVKCNDYILSVIISCSHCHPVPSDVSEKIVLGKLLNLLKFRNFKM